MNTVKLINRVAGSRKSISRFSVFLLCCAFFVTSTNAQQTPGGTVISNQASATYSDGTDTYSTVSNTVTVTVSNVSGLTITPDAGSLAAIIPGQTGVLYIFRVTNTGNFSDQVRFLASGASIQISGSGVIFAAVIDVNASGTINGGDTDILTNGSDVLSASIAQNGYVDVIVSVNVNSNASAASTINIQLGDATNGPTYDNQAAGTISAHEVRTDSGTSVNGLREARGDISATVDTDALLVLSLTAPAGPVALATDITYSWQLCNTNGARAAQSTTLTGAPGGSNTGVFIIAPIPVGTSLKSGQSFPAGTLYSISALTVSPLTATYTTSAPGDLTTVRRMAFRVGATLTLGTCATAVPMVVTITTTDATLDIFEIGDSFAMDNVGGQITDQSGDLVANVGDGNANFTEGSAAGNVDGDGILQVTVLSRGSGLIGPLNTPTAVGPTNTNDDYTNRSITTGIAGIAFGGTTNADGTIVYSNTLSNTGNADDTFDITVPSKPSGFTVEISLNGGTNYTTMTSNSVNLPIAFEGTATILVRVTAPSGSAVLQAGGFVVVVRSTSTTTPAAYNETIDRLYTGFLRMVKTAPVTNGTGVGGATDPVPGAVIEYTIVYTNISSTGGTGNSLLTVSNLVITENGSAGSNNWGTTTDHVASSASDTLSGTITGDSAGSTVLTDTVSSLTPGQSGTFKFRRVIR